MSNFEVGIWIRLRDLVTGPAKKVGQSVKEMERSVKSASAGMQRSTGALASGMRSIGVSAASSQKQVAGLTAQLNALAKSQMFLASRAGRSTTSGNLFLGGGGGGGIAGGMAAWFGVPAVFKAALETARAENKFRALVDSATPEQMTTLRSKLQARMLRSGEAYAELMDAAGDAAQIVGGAALSGDIAITASKLKNIDTAGKSISEFAENLAAAIGPNGTVEQLNAIGASLAKQQQLGAATAGGSLEAYKNAASQVSATGTDIFTAFAAIGAIKNSLPALMDSQIGTDMKYALRMFYGGTNADTKAMGKAGLKREMFLNEKGNFDLLKAHEILTNLKATAPDKFRALFAGRNMQASQFWNNLLRTSPEELRKRDAATRDGGNALDKADDTMLEGLVGSWHAIKGSAYQLSQAIGQAVTPAFQGLAAVLAPVMSMSSDFLKTASETAPLLTSIGAGWALIGTGLAVIGTFSTRAAALSSLVFRFPLMLARIGSAGVLAGLVGAGAGLARMVQLAFRFAGAAGVARVAMRSLLRMTGIGLAVEGLLLLYQHWEKVKLAFSDPLELIVKWPEMPDWLKSILEITGKGNAQSTPGTAEHGGGWFTNLTKRWFGSADPSQEWFTAMHERINAFDLRGGMPLPMRKPAFSIPLPDRNPMRGLREGMVPEALGQKMAGEGAAGAPQGITVQANGPNVQFNQAPPNISISTSVTVNATTNASPNEIGSAVANQVSSRVRGALSDATITAP